MNFKENVSSFKKNKRLQNTKSTCLDKNLLKKNSSKIKNLEKFSFFFRLKSLIYLFRQDKKLKLTKYFVQKPIYHSFNLIKSYLRKQPYTKEENDLFLFNFKSFNDLKNRINNKNTLLVLGFSYCMKPKECPKKRFSFNCLHDPNNDHCKNCFICMCINAMNKEDIFLVIPDAYYISDQLLKIKNMNPNKELIFITMTCNLSIHMFADLANTLKMKGLAIALSGRVCKNYKSFLYAEIGKKASITSLSQKNQNKILSLLQDRSRNINLKKELPF